MESRFEIIVEVNGTKHYLETTKDDSISLTYNVADIADISARNSSYSKTIRIPETRENRKIFGDISDLSVDSDFNPNKKSKAWLLVDTVLIFEGYLQLRKAIKDELGNVNEYEVVIYAENDNFFKQLGENYLTNLDFSELNHDWTEENIKQSWTASWETGYYYPLIDYGRDWTLSEINGYNTEVKVGDMFPSTNVKYIWNKIFQNAGFTYESDFLNDKIFENLYIPFNRSKVIRDANDLSGRLSIGLSQSEYVYTTANVQVNALGYTQAAFGMFPAYFIQNTPNLENLGTYRYPFKVETTPFGDPDNLYDNTLYEYVADSDFVAQRFVVDFDITFPFVLNVDNYNLSSFNIKFKRSRNPITGTTPVGGYVVPVNGLLNGNRFTEASIPGIQYSADFKTVTGQISTDMLDQETGVRRKLYPGEKLWVEITINQTNRQLYNYYQPGVGQTTAWTLTTGATAASFNNGSNFFNILGENVQAGELIYYNYILPDKLKQRDFITTIIKMFNLYIEPSKDYNKHLIIEPRDNYYESGEIKDWTRKLDINETIEEQILGETQNRTTIFKYKDDKDYLNEDYKQRNGNFSYGEFRYEVDNDFINGEKKVELECSPTPIAQVPLSVQFIIPKIGKINNGLFSQTEHNWRILTRYQSSTETTWTYNDYIFHTSDGFYNAYVALTTDSTYGASFSNAIHDYEVGDYINIQQADGGALKPMLQGNFKIVEVPSNKTIVINITFDVVGSGPAIDGLTTPLDGLLPTADDWDRWKFEGEYYQAYPYLGNFDNPQSPHYDLNYGQTTGLYYTEETVTDDNLFSVYWKNQMDELSDRGSRIITASFYLTSDDIARFRFNDKIFIDNQYYKVNKILNYDPTEIRTTKVELIKTKFITIPKVFRRRKPNFPALPVGVGTIRDAKKEPSTGPINTGVILTNNTNTVSKNDAMIAGRNNISTSNKNLIVGDNNRVTEDKAFVNGSNNNIQEQNAIVLGDNNTILPEAYNSVVIGNNQTVGGERIFQVNATLVQAPDEITAGRNEVIGLYPTAKVINYIYAGRNEVRGMGSNDIIMHVCGGRYDIAP